MYLKTTYQLIQSCLKLISNIIQSDGFLGSLLGKIAGLLMKVATPLAIQILASLGTTATALAIDVGIQKTIQGSKTRTFIILNKEKNDIIVQGIEVSNNSLEQIIKTLQNETKKKRIFRNFFWKLVYQQTF